MYEYWSEIITLPLNETATPIHNYFTHSVSRTPVLTPSQQLWCLLFLVLVNDCTDFRGQVNVFKFWWSLASIILTTNPSCKFCLITGSLFLFLRHIACHLALKNKIDEQIRALAIDEKQSLRCPCVWLCVADSVALFIPAANSDWLSQADEAWQNLPHTLDNVTLVAYLQLVLCKANPRLQQLV